MKAEKHFKHIAAKTCNVKSENQVKGKVKAKTTTYNYLLDTMFKMSVVDCPEPLQNLLHRPGFALMNMGVKNPVNNTIRIKSG
jgi:hypothetical protein